MRNSVLILILMLSYMMFVDSNMSGDDQVSKKPDSTFLLFDFIEESDAENWYAVNDVVMGGVSKGIVSKSEDSRLLFSGSLSLENNGGFASIRTKPKDFGISGFEGIRIRVKGDGRTYQFRLRTDRYLDSVAFKHEFVTIEDTWVELDFPFSSFIPTYRGRIMTDVKTLEAADIRQLGFLLADKKAGPFNLLIDKIVAFKKK